MVPGPNGTPPLPYHPQDFQNDRLLGEHQSRVITRRNELGIDLGLDPAKHVVYVPTHHFVEPQTDVCLDALKSMGLRVDKRLGGSAIDFARNIIATEALDEGLDSLLFIDADIMFDPADALKLLLSDEPLIAATYAAKELGPSSQMNADFDPAVNSEGVRYGEWGGLYQARKVGAGFLRIKTWVLRSMIGTLDLPRVVLGKTTGWPFFMPGLWEEDGELKYHCEDYAFCRRCRDAGIPLVIDTAIRLYHLGTYTYGVEESGGAYIKRYKNIILNPRTKQAEVPADCVANEPK